MGGKLDSDVQSLKGIGAARAERLAVLGIHTVSDLLKYFPASYEDRNRVSAIRDLRPGDTVCVAAAVTAISAAHYVRSGLEVSTVTVEDDTGRMQLVFFNQKFTVRSLKPGMHCIFYGAVSEDRHSLQMKNPVFESPDSPGVQTRCILPVYRLTTGITWKILRDAVRQALDVCGSELPEFLPDTVCKQYNLCSACFALENIHFPQNNTALQQAQRRLAFEEFFVFSARMKLRREQRRTQTPCPCPQGVPSAFYQALPFSLTGSQIRAVREVETDMASGFPMCRLIQGDTGCGKTMVAAAAIACASAAGFQSALMVPVQILAEQHYASLAPLLEQAGIRTVLLTGATAASQRRHVLEAVADGTADLVIGTQTLLGESVIFHKLGLVVSDEQHRFGVNQRTALAGKGAYPHVLLMSATPIPRTLAMAIYGDMEVSVIDERPPGRRETETFPVSESLRPRVYAFARRQVQEGHQVYIICPAVETGEENGLKTAFGLAEELQRSVFSDLHLNVLHGQLKGAEKERIMREFAQGKIDILVSTTVVETGVDVPNATLIIIENAERFGLNQLHQLRGRVGRGQAPSYCILFSENRSEQTLARLKTFSTVNDGFQLAEKDLELRGPGDFLGTQQHGIPAFRCAGMVQDIKIIQQAREAAEAYMSSSPESPDPERKCLQTFLQKEDLNL